MVHTGGLTAGGREPDSAHRIIKPLVITKYIERKRIEHLLRPESVFVLRVLKAGVRNSAFDAVVSHHTFCQGTSAVD